jgi:sulfane dehydrogenase subunit SoxC
MNSKQSSRRRFLQGGAAALAGLTVGAIRPASGQTPGAVVPEAPSPNELIAYGERSRFVKSVRKRVDGFPAPYGQTPHLLTPLQDSVGIITPTSLHYVAGHTGFYVPEIDPQEHRLLIHGMVDRPLIFTMEELKRFPYVIRIHYLECNGNSHSGRMDAKTVQDTHGRTSCSEWTGVPLSLLLKEAGLQKTASWIIAEGAEAQKGTAPIPLAKAMDDTIVAYAQNGEPVRPQQGFPLRLVVPGFEGLHNVKWLRRIKVVDKFYLSYNLLGRYMTKRPEPWFNYEQGPKSVITFPSGGQRLPSRGVYEITGLAWSGGGAVRRVEVSTNGGRTWKDAKLEGPVYRMAHSRFHLTWNWEGEEADLQSRCTDERGQIQPTLAQFNKLWGLPSDDPLEGYSGHYNYIQPWKVTPDGSVQNGDSSLHKGDRSTDNAM